MIFLFKTTVLCSQNDFLQQKRSSSRQVYEQTITIIFDAKFIIFTTEPISFFTKSGDWSGCLSQIMELD